MNLVEQIFRTAKALRNAQDRALKAQGLSIVQFEALNLLLTEGKPANFLAKKLEVDASNITGIIRRLRKAKLIQKCESDDKRQHCHRATEIGVQTAKNCQEALAKLQARFDSLNSTEILITQQTLGKLHEHANQP